MQTVDLGVFFFFQAEDGIRDFHVTGVQTCALPISDYLHRVGKVRVVVLEMEYDGPPLRDGDDERTSAESVEVHAAVQLRQTSHEFELDRLARRVGTEPGRIYYSARCL